MSTFFFFILHILPPQEIRISQIFFDSNKYTQVKHFLLHIVTRHTQMGTQHWPLYERTNILIQRLVEQGLINYFNVRMTRLLRINHHNQMGESKEIFSMVTLNDMQLMLVMYFVGIVTSSVIFLIEMIPRLYKNVKVF